MSKVKCLICGEYFDKDKENSIKIKNRYVHDNCYENTEEGQKYKLENYILNLFGIEKISPLIKKQIENYYNEKKYSYLSILFTLKYFFEIQNGDVTKAKGIGIVPYVYEDAKKYYEHLTKVLKETENLKVPEFKKIFIKITSPKRIEKRKKIDLNLL